MCLIENGTWLKEQLFFLNFSYTTRCALRMSWYSLNPTHLTHWGRVTHISSLKWVIIGWRQAIIWTNAGILLNGPLGTNFSEILIKNSNISIQEIAFENVICKMAPILFQPELVHVGLIYNQNNFWCLCFHFSYACVTIMCSNNKSCDPLWHHMQGTDSILRCLTSIGNPIVEIRWSQDCLISTIGICYTGKMASLYWNRAQSADSTSVTNHWYWANILLVPSFLTFLGH